MIIITIKSPKDESFVRMSIIWPSLARVNLLKNLIIPPIAKFALKNARLYGKIKQPIEVQKFGENFVCDYDNLD